MGWGETNDTKTYRIWVIIAVSKEGEVAKNFNRENWENPSVVHDKSSDT